MKLTAMKTELLEIEEIAKRNRLVINRDNLTPINEMVINEILNSVETSPKGRRYSQEWIYECIMFRLKAGNSPYLHLRKRGVLPLPCKRTIQNYMSNMESTYGFQDVVFQIMKEKSANLSPSARRGQYDIYMNFEKKIFLV